MTKTAMDPQSAVEKVRSFLDSHAAGWITEKDAMLFFDEQCPVRDVCVAISQLSDESALEAMLKFLENVVAHERVAEQLVVPEMREFRIAACHSPSERLRNVVVSAVSNVRNPNLPAEIDIGLIMALMRDEETGIALRASKLVLRWLGTTLKTESAKAALTNRLLAEYKIKRAELNETEEFRFISLFIEIARLDNQLFKLIESETLLSPIVDQFLSSSSDLLVKLGSLTLIESLSEFSDGQMFLADSNILLTLDQELTGPLADSTTVISVLLSMARIMPFVDHTDQIRRVLLSPSGEVPKVLSHFITSSSNAERMCAMKVYAAISAGADKSEPIATFLRQSWRALGEIVFALSDVDVEVINTALDALHTIVKKWERNPFMESFESQNRLIQSTLDTLRRHPFPECRCLVYALLGAIVLCGDLSDSGLALILSEPSPIRAAMLNFQSESNYDSRVAKCDFVRIIVKMEDKNILKRFFKKDEVENLIDYAEKGLEYVPVTSAKDEMETEAL